MTKKENEIDEDIKRIVEDKDEITEDDLFTTRQKTIKGMRESSTVYPTTHHIYIRMDGADRYYKLCGDTTNGKHVSEIGNRESLAEGWYDYSELGLGYSCRGCAEVAKRLLDIQEDEEKGVINQEEAIIIDSARNFLRMKHRQGKHGDTSVIHAYEDEDVGEIICPICDEEQENKLSEEHYDMLVDAAEKALKKCHREGKHDDSGVVDSIRIEDIGQVKCPICKHQVTTDDYEGDNDG